MDKLISIVVPIYNVEPYIRQCIESILSQTYKNIEIILVNDGSTDGCGKICDEYASSDSRIKVIHQNNKGLVSARKAGISIAKGEYVGAVDGDDWIEPQMYEALLLLAYTSGAAVVDSGIIDTYSVGDDYSESYRFSNFNEGYYCGEDFERSIIPKLMYTGSFFKQGIYPYIFSKLIKREVLFEYQMQVNESSFMGEDASCIYPSIVKSESLYVTHQCFYHYRVVYNSLKRTSVKNAAQIIKGRIADWKGIFDQSKYRHTLNSQLVYYAMYLLVWKAPSVFENDEMKCLIPYGGIDKGSKIVLYGAGAVGIQLYNYIASSNCCEIIYWADKNYDTFADLSVKSPTRIIDVDFDYLVIAIFNRKAYVSAKNDLILMGVDERKIRWIDEKYIENPRVLIEQCLVKDVFEEECSHG
ncbi:hypothetical protein A7K91_06205 [Paenibacillus oryzae]|uniref:Glycosyltransferase 2-like domain-containing protein n=1 Tax=Paenibacillus oryzae TaxID=1844972 RepID=A0A1A5YD77_9BACL|nr:glycosyltransferase family 2 protein [Paenibacillus oryzae]OBR63544.1 hypothetical protein A7K91_06205 [Paenibacillus oryzae]